MNVGVVQFPGSNDERDAAWAVRYLGGDADLIWHGATSLGSADAIILPGGFSYGDYLRCGAIARFAKVMPAVVGFARAGGPVLGICNGFQVLCEAGLLPGALVRNAGLKFVCRPQPIQVEQSISKVLDALEGDVLVIPVKHGEGCWFADDALYDELETRRQIVLRYAEPVNGSRNDVAGVVNERGNVMGLMPHPEHAMDPLLGSADGALILSSLVDAARDCILAGV